MISSEIRAEARRSLSGKWGKAAILSLTFAIISYLISLVLNFVPLVGPIANLVITPALSFGFLIGFINLRRGKDVGYVDFFQNGFSCFGKLWAVILNTLLKLIIPIVALIISIIIFAVGISGTATSAITSSSSGGYGFVFFIGVVLYIASIIWVIVKGLSYSLVNYILYDNPDMDAKDIVEKSEELMKGHKWAFFWLPITFIGWGILASLTFGIGMLWLLPYMQISQIIFYEDLAGTPSNSEKVEDYGPISE